jgi:hypothetical protein
MLWWKILNELRGLHHGIYTYVYITMHNNAGPHNTPCRPFMHARTDTVNSAEACLRAHVASMHA